jgi:hypothetical protein
VIATVGVVTGLQVTVFGSQNSDESHGGVHVEVWHLAFTQTCPPVHAGKHPPFGITQTLREGSHFEPDLQSASVLHVPERLAEQARHAESIKSHANRIEVS